MNMEILLISIILLSLFEHFSIASNSGRPSSKQLSQEEKDLFLQTHNKFRKAALEGKIPNQPAALEMPMLIWDDDLAKTAANWSTFCTIGHDTLDARKTANFTSVGQNVAGNHNLESAIEMWYSEYKNYSIYNNSCNGVCGHYTQVVWAASTNLGCGYTECSVNFPYGKCIVCNYGPGGNIPNRKPYQYNESALPTTTKSGIRVAYSHVWLSCLLYPIMARFTNVY